MIRSQFYRETRRGFAMMFAILAIVAMTLLLTSALKNSDLFKNLSVVQTQQAFQSLEVETQLRGISLELLAKKLDTWLLPSSAEPAVVPTSLNAYSGRLISNNAGTGAGGAFDTWVNTNFVVPFNSDPKNQGKVLAIRCMSQQDPTVVNAGREPCTNQRLHDPKLFEIVLRMNDPMHHTVTSITQEVQITRSLVSQYTYVVTSSKNPIALGRAVFNSPVGLFFDQPYAPQSTILFTACANGTAGCLGSAGTVFNAPLVTNLVNETQLIDYLQPTYIAGKSVRETRYAEYPKNLLAVLQTSYAAMKEGVKDGTTTVNPGNPLTQAERDAAQQCYDNWNGGAATADCSIRSEYSAYLFNACNISMIAKVSWAYKGPNVVAGPPPHYSLATYTVQPWSSQATFEGEALFLPGTAYIKEYPAVNANGPASQLCANMTLMADNIVIQNSLVRTSPAINSALFAKHSISLASNPDIPQDDAYFDDGSRLWTMKASSTVFHNRPGAGFTIDASLIADSPSGGFVVPPTYYDGVPGWLKFGELDIKGMVISSEAYVTSAYNASWKLSGFTKVVMGQGGTLSENPPPGMKFVFDSGLTSILITTSVTSTAIPDAIAYVSK